MLQGPSCSSKASCAQLSSALGEGHPLELYHVEPMWGMPEPFLRPTRAEIELFLSVPLQTRGSLTFQLCLTAWHLSMTGLTPCWPYHAPGSTGSRSRDFGAAVVGDVSIPCSSGII